MLHTPRICSCRWLRRVLSLSTLIYSLVHGTCFSQQFQERQPCLPGFYCPLGNITPVPCPKGTYGPTTGAESIDRCLKCPPHHYCPRPGLAASLPCGPAAQQPLSGQVFCICPGQGQSFQASDGQCHCTIGYQPSNNGSVCVNKLYDVCRDGKARTQYGDCMDRYQWLQHCREQVCQSADDYQAYNGELGLCICREPPGRVACDGLCRRRPTTELKLQCRSNGELELVYDDQVLGISGSVLETLFIKWDPQRNFLRSSQLIFSHPVYIVQTTESGFFGLLSGIPEVLHQMFPVTTQQYPQRSAESHANVLLEVTSVENISHRWQEQNSSNRSGNQGDSGRKVSKISGVLNPTACFHMGDVILFTVDTHHYPQYDLDNLYNTNTDFDWGAFRKLEEELTLSWTPPGLFSAVFHHPGVYAFKLSSHQHKHMYVRVMPEGGWCYEPGPFFPSTPHHITRMGIRRRHNLLLRPDWRVTGGLLFGAVVILCLCVTLLILFSEYGWPEKEPIRVRYHFLQLAFHMEDYSSKGSRMISLKKIHRNQQARMTEDSIQPAVCSDTSDEFWDYEHQVDLEAFSSNTFYNLLLKQSLSVTTSLGQLTTEVKALYQGVLGKLQLLQTHFITEEKKEEGYERMRMEVERDVARRKNLASQLRTLLNSQLEVLRREQQAQQRAQSVFTAHLRECIRLLSKIYNSNQPSSVHQQILIKRLTSLVNEMGEQVSTECHRQGAWGLLGQGIGAMLFFPDTGTVLTKDHMFSPDGFLRDCRALHCDPVTGLIRPSVHSHMLLSSGHTMAVPPDFFLHPHTGRVMPIVGNVAYDPTSSALVPTADSCTGDNRKWDIPLIPFIPYPTSHHSDQPLSSTRLRGLRPGQKLQLGFPMADHDTGVPVPILAVTIHPQTGLVYPLGGMHICPITRLPQPIQIGYPMLDSKTGKLVLTSGVSLDPVTGSVIPVGGILLAESVIEPLSGRMVKVGGASMRAGQLLPNAGGYQALLDSKVLAAKFKALELLKQVTDQWGSHQIIQHHQGSERSTQQDDLLMAAKELQQACERSLHCQLQLHTRLDMLLDWTVSLQQDGGALGEMLLPGLNMPVPALLGMEYPDPMGSSLSVPVLGCQTDPSGTVIPLAGTMEDPGGKGLVPIRYGFPTVDPVTGALAPVVGARLDALKKTVVPVTAFSWLALSDQTDSVQVGALQREACARNSYWQQQRQREEDLLCDLDSGLFRCLFRVTEANCYEWSGRQLRQAAIELQDLAQTEAQRRAAQCCHLALVLPARVLHILTLGDEEEWNHQCVWHSELLSGLDKVDAQMEQLQEDQEKWLTQDGDRATMLRSMDIEIMQRELWEWSCSRRTELENVLNVLHIVRRFSQLRANMAQAVLGGDFCCKEYGLVQCSVHRPTVMVMGVAQQLVLPLLEKLNQILEEKPASLCLRITAPSLKEPAYIAQSENMALRASLAPTCSSRRFMAPASCQLQESQPVWESEQPAHLSIPDIPEEEWSKLLEHSPLFQLLNEVQLQLKGWACGAGLLRGQCADKSSQFIDVLDGQWQCEGELIPLELSVLHPRELLVYQHGLFLIHTLNNLKLTPVISLEIAASLPTNNYVNNPFRHSFFYQEAEQRLFVRRQRLQSVGGFSLLLLHCLSHVAVKDMSCDSSPAFQRLFFKVLQECLGELF